METENQMNRRGFFKNASITAISIAVGANLWGCTKEPKKDILKNKEASSSQPSPSRSTKISPADASALVEKYEASGIHTINHQGKWKGKDASHLPQVTLHEGEGEITLFTEHPMKKNHWITSHYLRNQDGKLIGFQFYEETDPEARHRFEIPKGTTKITAFSHCNKHGVWKAKENQLG
jgi:desulfoferrodoxin (superoxide reductase-like protein)